MEQIPQAERGNTTAILAAFVAATCCIGLALQLVLIVGKLGLALGLWRYLGYFTILTNFGAGAVATAIAIGHPEALAAPGARLMAATSMALVGITYSVALRALWHPTGLQKLADMALHDAAPMLFVVLWAAAPHPGLKWREIGWALLPPALYAAYALARGAIDGWYAYWFLNPAEQGLLQLLASVTLMLAGFALAATLLVAIDRRVGRIGR